MKHRINFKSGLLWAGILAFWALVIFSGSIKLMNSKALQKQQAIVHQPCQTMFKTIPDPENALGLIGFEQHEDGTSTDGEETYVTYNVVVKEIDNQGDDYKALCRNIVKDIVETCGNKEIVVNIYDSSEAYALAAASEAQFHPLKKEEEITLREHLVASYGYGDEYGDENHYLAFYPQAGNSHSETEVYSSL